MQGITCNGNQIVAVLLILFGLQGHLPTELGLLTNVEYFDFSSNMMSGTVPTQVGNLRAYSFDARNAVFLSGTIPAELCEVTSMNRLQWGNTRVSGTLPAEVGKLQSMKFDVSLAGTQMSGTLPTQLGLWTNLENGLNLHGAALSGAIPTELGALKKLSDLDVGGNQLSGTLPSQLVLRRGYPRFGRAPRDRPVASAAVRTAVLMRAPADAGSRAARYNTTG